MRRAPIVLAATIAGTAGVLAFNPQPQTGGSAATEAPLPALTRTAAANAIVLGPAVPNQFGTVQVQVAKANGRIVDVRAVQLPGGDGTSAEISAYAGPLLKRQALTAQTAKLDGVSGATYTSEGYRTSLQAALDRVDRPAGNGAPA
jgi:uncharacterized protein with FMN-binding domain